MADKYPNAPYPAYGMPSAPPSAPHQMHPQMPGQGQMPGPGQMPGQGQMPYPQYYPPPPSYDAAMRGGPPGMPSAMPQPQMYPQVNPGYPQPMQQPQYYPPAMPQYNQGPPQMQNPGYPPYQPPHQQQPGQPGPGAYYGAAPVAPVTAVFDSGARFNNGSITVPPPPPGYMPTAAQAAAMNGQSVHVQKEKNNFFTGGKGAGFTFW